MRPRPRDPRLSHTHAWWRSLRAGQHDPDTHARCVHTDAHTYAYIDAHTYAYFDTHTYAYIDAYADTYTYSNADRDGYSHTNPDGHHLRRAEHCGRLCARGQRDDRR